MKKLSLCLLFFTYALHGDKKTFCFGDTCYIKSGPTSIRGKYGKLDGTLYIHTGHRTLKEYMSQRVQNIRFVDYTRYLAKHNKYHTQKPHLRNIPENFHHDECWYVTVDNKGYYVHPSWLQKVTIRKGHKS